MKQVSAILIVVFLACPLLFAALVSISLGAWVMDRQLYLSLLDDQRLFQVPDAVSSASWSAAVIEGTGGLRWHSLGRAARAVLTPEYLRGQARRVVTQVFDWLDGRTGRLDISIDAAPVKGALRGDAGRQFSRLLAEDLPVGGNPADFTLRPGHLPVSRPSAVSVERAAAIIQAGLPTFVRDIPDTIGLNDDAGKTSRWGGGPRIHLFGAFLAADIILLLLAGGFLTAAVFLGGRTLYERLQWSGWPLLVPAACVLLMGLVVLLVFSLPWVQGYARLEAQGFDASFISALIDAARHIISRVGIGFVAAGGIAAGAALGLLAWSWSIPQSERKSVNR